MSQPLLRVTVDHAASILVIPVAQEQHGAQGPAPRGSASAPSAGLVGMQSGEGPWWARQPGLAVDVWSSGAAQGLWGPWWVSGHCVTGKSNRWAGTEDMESTQMGSCQGDHGGLTWRRTGFHSRGGGAGWSGRTFSSYTAGSGSRAPLYSGWTAGPAGDRCGQVA